MKGASDGINKFTQEVELLANEYRNEDDEYLKRKLKDGRPVQQTATAKVLKERGYGSQS